MKTLLICSTILVSLLFLPGKVEAACYKYNFSTVQRHQFNLAPISVKPGLELSSILAETSVPIYAQNGVGACNWLSGGYQYASYKNMQQKMPSITVSNTYQTNVEGIGVRVYREANDGTRSSLPYNYSYPAASVVHVQAGSMRLQVVKTAAVTGTGVAVPPGQFAVMYLDQTGEYDPIYSASIGGAGIVINSTTCEVHPLSKNITVDLGETPSTTFSGIGSYGSNRDFEIKLLCQGGNGNMVGIRIDANRDNSNEGVIKIDQQSNSARGIGIKLTQRSEAGQEIPLQLGRTINVGKATMNRSEITLRLRAKYIQTQAGKVSPGLASGQATFTIEYQ